MLPSNSNRLVSNSNRLRSNSNDKNRTSLDYITYRHTHNIPIIFYREGFKTFYTNRKQMGGFHAVCHACHIKEVKLFSVSEVSFKAHDN